MTASADDRLVAELAAGFEARFRDRVPSPRTVGREAEYPLVRVDGTAGDAASVWPELVEEGCAPLRERPEGPVIGVDAARWSAVTEVGRGTLEVVVGPRPSLLDLAQDLDLALEAILPAARRAGYRVLGYGIQPRTPPHPGLLAPKRRYPALLRAIGPRWLRFAVTASDQVHVDVARDEMIAAFNVMNGLAGALIALTANSSVYGGRPGRYASGREGLMVATTPEPYRHGAIPRAFADVEEYVRWAARFRCLCLPGSGEGFRFPRGSYLDHARGRPVDLEEFLFHEHYLWPSARPRARLGTLEVRPACQQPQHDSWAPAALALGLVEMLPEARRILEEVPGADAWGALLAYRSRAVRDGLAAEDPTPGFLESVLDVAERGLKARGHGDEDLLSPLRERLAVRSGPADRARALARSGGAVAVANALALR
jgi:gamma-glutamylcysteine synthetase